MHSLQKTAYITTFPPDLLRHYTYGEYVATNELEQQKCGLEV
jgi:hypothetical protein